MRTNYLEKITMKQAPGLVKHAGLLDYDGTVIPCSLGKNGISSNKFEGDATTPRGKYRILFGFYRRDRMGLLRSALPLQASNTEMGWCDAPDNPNYNRLVDLPFSAGHEKLMRDDSLYDICIVMDHNYSTRTRSRGSAVFFHLTNEAQGPTQGCVAIAKNHMLQILPRLTQNTIIEIIA